MSERVAKWWPAALELGAQLAEVVDLAVEDDADRAVLVEDRLVAARQVDDRQAAHPQGDARGVETPSPSGPRWTMVASMRSIRASTVAG